MKTFLAALAAFFMSASVAFAADGSAVPDAVIVPYGDMLAALLPYVATALSGVVIWAMRFLPAQLRALALTMQADHLLEKAVTYGCNAVAGATKSKTLTVTVSNAVLREALEFALLHSSDAVMRFVGAPVDVAEKIWARLDVDEKTSKPNFALIADEVSATMRDK